jgi:hypothetical protein
LMQVLPGSLKSRAVCAGFYDWSESSACACAEELRSDGATVARRIRAQINGGFGMTPAGEKSEPVSLAEPQTPSSDML